MIGKYNLYEGSVVKILSCSDCNIKCKHCYISFTGNFDGSELLEVVTNLSKHHEVRINGTEPLLHKEYLSSLEKANQKLVLTNGLVFANNYDYLDEIKASGITTIGISYHFDWHDTVSKVSKEYLEKLFKLIILKKLDVQVMTTITSKNYKKVEQYCDFCKSNGIRHIRFTNFMLQGNARSLDSELILTQEQINEFLFDINVLRKKYKKDELDIQRCGSFGPFINSNFECTSGTDSVVLTPDYRVYPCLFMAKTGNEIGFYDDGKIFVEKEYSNNSNKCKALKKYNNL